MAHGLLTLLLFLGAAPAVEQPARPAGDAPVASDAAQPAPEAPVSLMTRAQLQQEYLRLADSRPSIVAPAFMSTGALISFVSGAVLLSMGLYALTPAGMAAAFASAATVLVGVGAALVAIGVVLGVIGGLQLFAAIKVRLALSRRLDAINELLEKPDHPGASPDSSRAVGPNPSWLIATF